MFAIRVGAVIVRGAANRSRSAGGSYLIKFLSMLCNQAGLPQARSLRLLRKPLDNPVEPLVHATQPSPQAVERRRIAHFGGGEILVTGVVAGELDARFSKLCRDNLDFRQRGIRGRLRFP
jgi:hypothetical protein